MERYKIKIENRGKVEQEDLVLVEELIEHISLINNKEFLTICPKMFYALKPSEIREDEICGFEFTILSSYFKGRIEIKLNKNNNYNVNYYRRLPTKGRFTYELYKKEFDILEKDLLDKFEFCKESSDKEIFVKKGDVVMLNTGFVAIIRKYYSNNKIGIIFDEDSEEIEEFISKENIIKKIR